MKKLYTLLVAVFITASTFAQAPEKMSYQAVIRDATGNLISNQAVGIQISILQTTVEGTAVYVETQTPTTNTNGLLSLEIGTGTIVTGSFTAIDWSADSYFIKTETDPTGGTNYTITGTSQLLSVPYALYAKTSGNGAGPEGSGFNAVTHLQTGNFYTRSTYELSDDGTTLAIAERNSFTSNIYVYKIESNILNQVGQTVNVDTPNGQTGDGPKLNINGTKLYHSFAGGKLYELINDTWTEQENTPNGKISSDFNTIVSSGGVINEFSSVDNQWAVTATIPGASGNAPQWDVSADGSVVMFEDYRVGVNVYQKINNNWTQMGNTLVNSGTDVNLPRIFKLSNDGQTIAFTEPSDPINSGNFNNYELKIYSFDQNQWTQKGSFIQTTSTVYDISIDNDGETISFVGDTNVSNGNFNANMSNMGVYTFEGNDWQQNYLNYDQSTNTSNAPQVYDISLRSGTLAYLRLRQPSQIYWQLNIHFVE